MATLLLVHELQVRAVDLVRRRRGARLRLSPLSSRVLDVDLQSFFLIIVVRVIRTLLLVGNSHRMIPSFFPVDAVLEREGVSDVASSPTIPSTRLSGPFPVPSSFVWRMVVGLLHYFYVNRLALIVLVLCLLVLMMHVV